MHGLPPMPDGVALILTATERLKSELKARLDAETAARGRSWWPAAPVYTLFSWLADLYDKSLSSRALAGDAATLALLAGIIEEDARERGMELLDVDSTARAALLAMTLTALYEINLTGWEGYSEESAAFARWTGRYREELAKRSWIDRPGLYLEGIPLIEKGAVEAPESVSFAGFDEIPPALSRLAAAFGARGSKVTHMPFPDLEGRKSRAEFPDPVSEVSAAALWAGAFLKKNPGARVGVAAIEMETYGPLAERIFEEKLSPLAALRPGGEGKPLFDISLGGPLADWPVAATALTLLELAHAPADTGRWLNLFASPFWTTGRDRFASSLMAAELALLAKTRLDAGMVIRALNGEGEGGIHSATDTAARLAQFIETLDPGRMAAPSRWAKAILEALERAGWPHGVTLRSGEYQTAEKFRETVVNLSALDQVMVSCGYDWILKRLRLSAQNPFRPKSGPAPITVMGILEAAGMSFDGLWILGASDGAFPPAVTVNPFIPYPLQVKHGVRQAIPTELLRRSEAIMKRLLGAGREVIVSHPQTDMGRAVTLGPSPLIRDLEAASPVFMEDYSLETQVRKKAGSKTVREKDLAPPLGEDEEVWGGAYIFASQAQCPFKAFTTIRLGASPGEKPLEGLGARDRGTMLHDALMHLHMRYKSGDEIKRASPDELNGAVSDAVRFASLKVRERGGGPGRAALALEEERTAGILRSWLEGERERDEFTVIERESARNLLVGKLRVKLKLDRVDRSEAGDLIIDYKTGGGNEKLSDLYKERLVKPQLPLYALACPEASGVAYAHLRKGEQKVVGLSAGPQLNGMTRAEDWEALKKEWRGKIDLLADEFASGRADADPGGKREYCTNCGLDPLCRPGGAGGGEEGE